MHRSVKWVLIAIICLKKKNIFRYKTWKNPLLQKQTMPLKFKKTSISEKRTDVSSANPQSGPLHSWSRTPCKSKLAFKWWHTNEHAAHFTFFIRSVEMLLFFSCVCDYTCQSEIWQLPLRSPSPALLSFCCQRTSSAALACILLKENDELLRAFFIFHEFIGSFVVEFNWIKINWIFSTMMLKFLLPSENSREH